MITDDSQLLFGKSYRFYRMIDVPDEHLAKIWGSTRDNKPLYAYITQRLNQPRVTPTPVVTCDKFVYHNKKAANFELAKIRDQQQNHRKPVRSYECDLCGGWHLTSMSIERFKEFTKLSQEQSI